MTATVKRECGIQRVDVKKRSGRGNLTFSIILCERFYVQFLHFMELDLVCFISIDFLHQRQHLYRGGHSLHSLYSGLPHSHNLVLGHNHISCVLRPESWGGGFFKIYLGEENISDIKNIDNMRIFITHLSRVKYRTKRPPPPQRRITRIPTRPAANRGSGYNTPDLFWRKERK